MNAKPNLVVVVPCYNEEHRFPQRSFLDAALQDPTLSFVLVDDGSKDGTREMLLRLHSHANAQFTVLGLDENCGKAEAVRRGLRLAFESAPELVAYIDADLATPLAELEPMRALIMDRPGRQAVLGSRVALLGHEVVRRPARHYFGRVFATLASVSLDLTVYDTQCGAKMFRNTAPVRSIFDHPFNSSWIFDVEILARLNALSREGALCPVGEAVAEYPLRTWRDVAGSKVAPRHAVMAMIELLGLRLRYRNGWQREETPQAIADRGPARDQRGSATTIPWDERRASVHTTAASRHTDPPQSTTRPLATARSTKVA